MTEKKERFPVRLSQLLIIAGLVLVIGIVVIYSMNQDKPPTPLDDGDSTAGVTLVDDVDFGDEVVVGDSEFSILLSEGRPQPQDGETLSLVTGEPLTAEEISAILARLPEIQVEPGTQVDFKLPVDLIPPPLPGETIDMQFPPLSDSGEPVVVDTGPLEVLRFAPEGEIPIAPFINVTFNQPMVPLGTIGQLSEEDVPVQVEPDLEGHWTWIGTRTLNFQYDSDLIDRLPMATVFEVTIPAGTESATGEVLAESVTWNFSTPPPSLISYYPSYGPQPLEPVIFIAFDQRVNPDAVMENITATADGKEFRINLATEEEINADKQVSSLTSNANEGRWLAVKALEPLPKDSHISIVIGTGTPSAEGPLVTTAQQSFTFYTYPPLKITDHGCSWSYNDCYPLSPFYIRFNNPIDPDKYEDSMITIEPALPGATVSIYGNTINISGATQGSTTYYVTVDESITDTFGQQLGRDEKLQFKVGTAEPVLIGPDSIFVTLDPAATDPALSLYTINYTKLFVQIYSVEPSDWPDFKDYLQNYNRTDQHREPPGKLVFDDTMNIETPTDVLTEVGVELSDVMDGDYGHFVVIVKPPTPFGEEERYWETVQVWVQVTHIGLDAFADHTEMVVWATTLQEGDPLYGVTIQSDNGNVLGTTDEEGLAIFNIPNSGIAYLVAEKGADKAMLPRSEYYWGDDSWFSWSPSDDLRWYVFDDRSMYRPGEEVHLKGWMRRIGGKQDGDVEMVGSTVSSVNYQIIGPQGNELGSGSADVNALGGFDFNFTLPEEVNLGYANIYLSTSGSISGVSSTTYYHSFQIQEFRRPEFEVTARNETTGPYFAGGEAIVAVEAAYYAGGPLPNADVTWYVNSTPTNYNPPNWPDFTFGTWTPWWWYGYFYEAEYGYSGYDSGYDSETFTGITDSTGNHYLKMEFDTTGEPRPYSILASSSVMDVNRQTWSGSTSLMVHPANLYVGLRTKRYFVDRGTPLDIDLIVTDLDGNPVVDRPIKVTAARLEWKYSKGSWREVEVDIQECTIGSKLEPVTCTFETPMGGRYQITAAVTDEMGRQNQSQITRWVSGGQQPPSREVEMEDANLIPDKETYQPGDVAEILVQSPFSPAEGLLTIARSGILYTDRFTIEDGSTTLKIPIGEEHIPNLVIQVDLVGSAPRTDDQGEIISEVPNRPAYASGQLTLSVPPLGRTLSLKVSPRDTELEPGGETTIDVVLKDANGKPVSDAGFVLVVVDEAVLALTNYQLADPMSVFYYARSADLTSTHGRASIILVDPNILLDETKAANAPLPTASALGQTLGGLAEGEMVEEAAAPSADFADADAGDDSLARKEGDGSADTPIDVRTDFNPLALFAPSTRTDSNGRASVRVTVPDNLTRYRIMVVAVDESGKQFGSAETSLTARLPLMVRPSASRFLNFGDQFELPVVLQNQTDEDMVVEVVTDSVNLKFTGSVGQRVTIPANDRIEVRFPGTTDSAGTAYFLVAAVSGEIGDASMVSLPVYTPATTEAFATYGVLDDDGAILQPIASPEGVYSQYGGLEITTSSTALQALTDAVLYLVSYPFDCSEQIASRMLAISALRDVLSAFEANGLPSPEAMEASVLNDIEELRILQNYDGGFPYWRRGQDSIPYNTVHVAHALQRARMMGFEVPEDMWQNVLNYLRNIENYYPSWYSLRTRQTISAYALYVRDRMGDSDVPKTRALFNSVGVEELPIEAVAWIWQVLIDTPDSQTELKSIRWHVNNRVVETAGAANFTTSYGDDAYLLLHSNRRTDALLLDALIADDPDHDLIPKLVTGLLAHRKSGRWYNTQENVFILLALDRYFDAYESQEPDFVAQMWLGETYVGTSEYHGYSTERQHIDVPMAYLIDTIGGEPTEDLIISKEGPGRLYYRLGLRYAPTSLKLDPVDYGFVVQRVYEAVDDPDDVYLDEDGNWHIKLGARVRVRITMVADNRRYHVALVAPIPAGLETINPALAVSEPVPSDPNSSTYRYWWWYWPWYGHQNLRDERAEAFTTLLWEGVYNYSFVARATMPGTFVVPPAKAEEMYSPEVFGRSGSDLVIIE